MLACGVNKSELHWYAVRFNCKHLAAINSDVLSVLVIFIHFRKLRKSFQIKCGMLMPSSGRYCTLHQIWPTSLDVLVVMNLRVLVTVEAEQ